MHSSVPYFKRLLHKEDFMNPKNKVHFGIRNLSLIRIVSFLIMLSAFLLLSGIGNCQNFNSSPPNNTFRMSINRPEGTPLYRWMEMVYKAVFKRLNIKLEMVYHPLTRASIEANKGNLDGEPARIQTYGKWYPNLIRLEESIYSMTVAAYKADSLIPELKGWESLQNTAYRIEYPRGMKICEDNLLKMVKPRFLSSATETSQGLQKLSMKRIDLYIDDLYLILPYLKDKKYNLGDKLFQAGVMEKVPLYMYVHKKNKPLVPQITQSIKTVKSEGLITHYYKIAFGPDEN